MFHRAIKLAEVLPQDEAHSTYLVGEDVLGAKRSLLNTPQERLPVYQQLIDCLAQHRGLLKRRGEEEKEKEIVKRLTDSLGLGIACARQAEDAKQASAWEKMLKDLTAETAKTK